MADTFLLEIITPVRKLFSEEVEEVTAPGEVGEFGVLPGHTNFFSLLKAGEISFKKGKETSRIASGRGYAEVSPVRTTILVDSAEFAEEIDVARAQEELRKAEEALKSLNPDDPAYKPTLDAKELSEARIRVKEGRKG